MNLKIDSPAFSQGGIIPREYTGEGDDISPALEWSGAPEGTASFALIVDDPDAPDPRDPKMTYVHWVLFDIPADCRGLKRAMTSEELPTGTREGLNDWKRFGYGGPMPPIGRHRYFHKIYALDTSLGDIQPPTKAALVEAMKGHVLAEAELMGTYQKGD